MKEEKMDRDLEKEENKGLKIGILGGMGPEATIYQYQLIVKFTPASQDQDHIPTIIYSNPLIPDRTASILTNSHEKIVNDLAQTAQLLESAGVSFIIIPCNTAHYYISDIQNYVSIPILDMIKITAEKVNDDYKQFNLMKKDNKIGLLATKGVVKARVYHDRFNKKNLQIKTPNDGDQESIMKIIYDIKAKGVTKRLKQECQEIMKNLKKNDSLSHIILGCTELPLLFLEESEFEESILINPMEILAKYVILKIKGKLKQI